MPEDALPETAVVGLGSPIMGDDGVGLAVLERLRACCRPQPPVAWIDGGTDGLSLLHAIEGARSVLFLDAVDAGLAPGTLIELEGEELPRRLSMKLSPHQIDLGEVLALAAVRGTLPERMAAIGVQPERVTLGVELSAPVAAVLDTMVEGARRWLGRWGHLDVGNEVAVRPGTGCDGPEEALEL